MMKVPKNMSNEERQLLEKWEQRIQKEKERMRKEREQNIVPSNLTMERKRIREVIAERSRNHRNRLYKETKDEVFRPKRLARTLKAEEAQSAELDSEPVFKAPHGRKRQMEGINYSPQRVVQSQSKEEAQNAEIDSEPDFKAPLGRKPKRVFPFAKGTVYVEWKEKFPNCTEGNRDNLDMKPSKVEIENPQSISRYHEKKLENPNVNEV